MAFTAQEGPRTGERRSPGTRSGLHQALARQRDLEPRRLYAVFVGLGVLETAADNSAFALLPSVVADEQLDRANARIVSAQLVADEFVGPPLGGFLFGVAAALPILFDAATFAGAAICVLLLRGRFREHTERGTSRTTVWRDVASGARWLRRHPLLKWLTVMFGLVSIAYMIPFSVLVLFAQDRLGLREVGYGFLLAASALGGLLGTAVAERARRRLGRGTTTLAAVTLGGLAYLVIATTTNVVLVGAMLALCIFHAVVWSVSVTSLRQELIPDDLRGRVNGAHKTIGLIGLTCGAPIGGLLAAEFGLTAPFWVAGALLLVVALAFLRVLDNAAIERARSAKRAHSM
ncbi:MFS transporter [Saccharomonospora piscinae]|uniref:MFS transporter n=1 Tax=Saccharomonospora piscinae TaxID=687388 RepID=UPI0009DF81EC